MAATQVPIGLNKQAKGDTGWDTALDSGIDDANTRLTLNGDGNPQGVVAAFWLGQKYYDTTNDELYFATAFDGTPGGSTWKGQSSMINDFALVFSQGIVFTGLATLNGGMLLPAGEVITVPSAEDWLTDGSDAHNPRLHAAARHHMTGADGAWVDAKDPLSGIINEAVQDDTDLDAVLDDDPVFTTLLTRVRDFTGRGSASSVLVLAQAGFKHGAGFGTAKCRIQMDAANISKEIGMFVSNSVSNAIGGGMLFALATGVAAASHTFTLQAATTFAGANRTDMDTCEMAIIDLGQG